MKILTAEQIRQVDQHTINNKPIASTDLMEQAAWSCTNWLIKNHHENTHFELFCGTGNNGGDGLAIARQLYDQSYNVRVNIISSGNNEREDFSINKQRLVNSGVRPNVISKGDEIKPIRNNAVIVDCIFGSGLNRPVEGLPGEIIDAINDSVEKVISIDLPSGLFCDYNRTNDYKHIIKADITLTLHIAKLALVQPMNGRYVGDFKILPIGIDNDYIESLETSYFLFTREQAKRLIKQRRKFSHKGTYGHAKLAVGSRGKMGAGILAANACLRAGAGLVTAVIPKVGHAIMQNANPEVMVEVNKGKNKLQGSTVLTDFSFGMGSGLGTSQETAEFVKNCVEAADGPIVIDADAINILAQNLLWMAHLPENSILTPHPKEFERLVGKWSSEEEKMQKLKDFCREMKCIVVLKGAHTLVANAEGEVYFNTTGNPGMATGGSGDVLTGIITGLLAQNYYAQKAALLGVYLHGLAGDIAVQSTGEPSLIASDITRSLGAAYIELS